MSTTHTCPQCQSENTYADQNLMVCGECFYEWDPAQAATPAESINKAEQALDSNGNTLATGDAIIVIKDVKVKGTAAGLKAGTKIKNIRIVDSTDGHNIACKVDGIGALFLKSELVKKA